jgi:predicted small secreted protein
MKTVFLLALLLLAGCATPRAASIDVHFAGQSLAVKVIR